MYSWLQKYTSWEGNYVLDLLEHAETIEVGELVVEGGDRVAWSMKVVKYHSFLVGIGSDELMVKPNRMDVLMMARVFAVGLRCNSSQAIWSLIIIPIRGLSKGPDRKAIDFESPLVRK